MISRDFYQKCIKTEIYKGIDKPKLSIANKIWALLFRPQSDVVPHLRKMQFWHKRCEIFSKLHGLVLNRRYGIYINPNAQIEQGIYFPHPTSICMTNVRIGKNFTCLQNCTIGAKNLGMNNYEDTPCIGNNVTLYANSLIIGKVNVADNVIVGANSCLLTDADVCGGVYYGSPAKIRKNNI